MKQSVFVISKINLIIKEEHYGINNKKTTQLLMFKEIAQLKYINQEVPQLIISTLIVILKAKFQINSIELLMILKIKLINLKN